jgi:uncharacterized protein (TIGR02001 family)
MVAVLLGAISAQAIAVEVTGNAGFVTDYIWRGADQSNGKAAAQGGLDLTAGEGAVQFYAGTWGSTVEYEALSVDDTDSISGIEIDLYTGISGELSDFSYGLGATYITYTDDVNPDYLEANVSLGYKWFTLDTAYGRYDQPDDPLKYTFAVLTAELNGFYGAVGYTEWEAADVPANALADGGYAELGYANTLQWEGKELFDYSFSYIYSEDDNRTANQSANKLIFGITKNFGILD